MNFNNKSDRFFLQVIENYCIVFNFFLPFKISRMKNLVNCKNTIINTKRLYLFFFVVYLPEFWALFRNIKGEFSYIAGDNFRWFSLHFASHTGFRQVYIYTYNLNYTYNCTFLLILSSFDSMYTHTCIKSFDRVLVFGVFICICFGACSVVLLYCY